MNPNVCLNASGSTVIGSFCTKSVPPIKSTTLLPPNAEKIPEIKKEEKLLEADYFIDVKSKQECYHSENDECICKTIILV